jgi:hypothetical protein
MTISLAHPEDFGIRAELLTGIVRLNLGSTCMSNGSWRDRLILRLFLGGDELRGLEKEKNRRHGQSLKSSQSLGRIIGKPGLGSGSRFEARALASPRRFWPWAVYSKSLIGLVRAATQLSCLIAVEQRPHRFDVRLI